jgi:hypothetical protein
MHMSLHESGKYGAPTSIYNFGAFGLRLKAALDNASYPPAAYNEVGPQDPICRINRDDRTALYDQLSAHLNYGKNPECARQRIATSDRLTV